MQDVAKDGSNNSYPSPSERLFNRILDAYLKAKSMPAIIAGSYDPADRPQKWSPRCADFIVDVEHAVKAALRKDATLIRAYSFLLRERAAEAGMVEQGPDTKPVSPGTRKRVIRQCTRMFKERGLSPGEYFRVIRRRAA